MAVAQKVLNQKRGVNFNTLVVQETLSGSYVTGGETVVLNGATIPNPGAKTVTGPSVPLAQPPRIVTNNIGGYEATLTPTANLLEFKLQFYTGVTELAAGAYPAAISGGTLVIEVDFGTGQFDS